MLEAASNQYINACGLYRRAATMEAGNPAMQAHLQQQADQALDLAEQALDFKDAVEAGVEAADEKREYVIAAAAEQAVAQAEAVLVAYKES